MFLLFAPTCGLRVLRKGRGGLWRWRQPSLSGGPQPWMHVFVVHALSRLQILPLLPSSSCLCTPTSSRWLAHTLAGAPFSTNDPANYVFRVFGSCENSFGLAVEGGGGQLERGGCVGQWCGPWSHGYNYCPALNVNTGLGQRGLIQERGGWGGGRLRLWILVSGFTPGGTPLRILPHTGNGLWIYCTPTPTAPPIGDQNSCQRLRKFPEGAPEICSQDMSQVAIIKVSKKTQQTALIHWIQPKG